MTKKEFIAQFAEKAGQTKTAAEKNINTFMEMIEVNMVAGEPINFIGWGKFETVERAERLGRNPRTGEEMKIAAKKKVKFTSGKKLNEAVN